MVRRHPAVAAAATDEHGKWAEALAEWIAETNCTPAELKAVCDRFELEARKLHQQSRLMTEQTKGTFPRAAELWFKGKRFAGNMLWVRNAFADLEKARREQQSTALAPVDTRALGRMLIAAEGPA